MNGRLVVSAVVGAVMCLSTAVLAQSAMTNGEVRKVDDAAGKITLHHGAAKNLGMDEPMTMIYRVQDPVMLKQVKVGDKVKFQADKVNGALTITKIERAK
jgi:Cu/Ag efflux protein CusF